MSLLRVNRCFCCFSLQTGVLVLLWMHVFGAFIGLFTDRMSLTFIENTKLSHYHIATFIVTVAVSIGGLYAVEKRKPSMLIPYLFYRTFTCLIVIGITIILPFVWSSIFNEEWITEMMKRYGDRRDGHWTDEEMEKNREYLMAFMPTVVFPVVEFLLIFSAVLDAYFILVVYSYYKVLVRELQGGVLFEVPTSIEKTDSKGYASNLYRDWNTDETTMAFSPPPYTPYSSSDNYSKKNGLYPQLS